jgi:hypothetical protein
MTRVGSQRHSPPPPQKKVVICPQYRENELLKYTYVRVGKLALYGHVQGIISHLSKSVTVSISVRKHQTTF